MRSGRTCSKVEMKRAKPYKACVALPCVTMSDGMEW